MSANGQVQKGWLSRWTRKQWSRHWFVLKNGSLTYYRGPAAELCSFLDGVLDLSLIKHIEVQPQEQNSNNQQQANLSQQHNQQPQQNHHIHLQFHNKQVNNSSENANNTLSSQFYFRLWMWNGDCHILGAATALERSHWLEAINATTGSDDDLNSSASSESSPSSNLSSKSADFSQPRGNSLSNSNYNYHQLQELKQSRQLDELALKLKSTVRRRSEPQVVLQEIKDTADTFSINNNIIIMSNNNNNNSINNKRENSPCNQQQEATPVTNSTAVMKDMKKDEISRLYQKQTHSHLDSNELSQISSKQNSSSQQNTTSHLLHKLIMANSNEFNSSAQKQTTESEQQNQRDEQRRHQELEDKENQAYKRRLISVNLLDRKSESMKCQNLNGNKTQIGKEPKLINRQVKKSNSIYNSDDERDISSRMSSSPSSSLEPSSDEDEDDDDGDGEDQDEDQEQQQIQDDEQILIRESRVEKQTTSINATGKPKAPASIQEKQKKRVTFDLSLSSRMMSSDSSSSGSSCSGQSDSELDTTLSSASNSDEEIEEQREQVNNRDLAHSERKIDVSGGTTRLNLSDKDEFTCDLVRRMLERRKQRNMSSAMDENHHETTSATYGQQHEQVNSNGTSSKTLLVGPNKVEDTNEDLGEQLALAQERISQMERKLNDSYSSYSQLELTYKRLQGEMIKCKELQKTELSRLHLRVDELSKDLAASEAKLGEARKKLQEHEHHLASVRQTATRDSSQSAKSISTSAAAMKALTWLRSSQQVSHSHKQPPLLLMHQAKLNLATNQQALGVKLLNHSRQIHRRLNELEHKMDKIFTVTSGDKTSDQIEMANQQANCT